jgi:hypothetical protein
MFQQYDLANRFKACRKYRWCWSCLFGDHEASALDASRGETVLITAVREEIYVQLAMTGTTNWGGALVRHPAGKKRSASR